jgi:hypothetical protein
MAGAEGPPAVGFPERLDRTLRLGPFPSGRDALRFVTYAAVGACLAPFVPTYVWLGIVLVGFASSAWKPGGETVERRVLRLASWELRRLGGDRSMRPRDGIASARRGHLRLRSGLHVAIVRAAGLPLAYLPSAELARRFELFRELLRGIDGGFALFASLAPIHARPFVPAEPAPAGPEGAARAGYRELVELIARGRSVRRVFVAIASADAGVEGVGRLEATTATLLERLGALGLKPVRLRDRTLGEAARLIGLAEGRPAP